VFRYSIGYNYSGGSSYDITTLHFQFISQHQTKQTDDFTEVAVIGSRKRYFTIRDVGESWLSAFQEERMKRLIQRAIRATGFDVVRYQLVSNGVPVTDLTAQDSEILQRIAGYTMTSVERQATLVSAVRYLVRRRVEGCIVECGVWRGGSSMAVALTLLQEDAAERDLYLFDTFEGMTPPTDADKTADGTLAQTYLDDDIRKQGYWCVAGIEDVQRNMVSTTYPKGRMHYIKGPVESTIPDQSPSGPIALLRLDTDWYESTHHELVHLFPRLVEGGILIIDDYGHWEGARKAVDEYLSGLPTAYYLHRIDGTGRILIKQ